MQAQEVPSVTNKVLIKNISVTTSPGATPFIGHILIEDGIITDVGRNVSAPFDAKVVMGDSLHAYAGFIATLSSIGLKEPKDSEERPKVARTGYPPNDVAGITPEQSVDKFYNSGESSIKDFRTQGFTVAHSVPYGRMMPGMGSIISLNGGSFNDAVVVKDNSMYSQWVTSRGVFPATLIGIMSKWREMAHNASLADKHVSNYKANPANRKRPSQDDATAALFPVINKTMPVFFRSEKHRDINRALTLQKELGFNLVLGEVKDVDRILPKVQKHNAGILLSLNLPKKEEEKKKKDDEEVDEEKEALQARKKAAVDRYVGQASMLQKANVPVAFSYMKVKAKDVHKNVKRMVESGLSEQNALAALTTTAAKNLGIENIAGTIDKGKMGNLVIMTKPFLSEDAKIKMVVVDGKQYEFDVKKKKKKKASSDEAVDVSGEWSFKMEIPGMEPSGTMTFTKDGDNFDLSVVNSSLPDEVSDIQDIEMDGNNMTYVYNVNAQGMNINIDIDITFEGDTFEGTISIPDFGSFPITGKKTSPE